jgi:hypothetical protein
LSRLALRSARFSSIEVQYGWATPSYCCHAALNSASFFSYSDFASVTAVVAISAHTLNEANMGAAVAITSTIESLSAVAALRLRVGAIDFLFRI